MADDRVVAKIVSEFFLSTCLPRRRLNVDDIMAMMLSSVTVSAGATSDGEFDIIPLSTGSVAEFYIEPMLSCVGDVDIMVHVSCLLAIPQGYPPPTQLPDEFHGRVLVFEIIDSEFPGYVYLVSSYLLTEITDDGKYNAVQCPRQYVAHSWSVEYPQKRQGPAYVGKNPRRLPASLSRNDSGSMSSLDTVLCRRCLLWPPQAADWPTRHRNYGWPDSATLDRVVSNGCDVVRVAHRQCRQHEWMSNHQWRLSFSRAEITLLNSWMPVQQIVYHMLRYFMKKEGLTKIRDSTGSKILSNYNIKTLMLWACEMKGRSWWIDVLNVVEICVKLLHILADWLSDARCPHYFINNCNLFDSLDNSQLTQNMSHVLWSVTEEGLAKWFVNNYIRKCARDLCPDSRVSRLFDDTSTHVKLQKAVSALVDWRLSKKLVPALTSILLAQCIMHYYMYILFLNLQTHFYLTRELSKTGGCLPVYFTAVTFLHVASKTNRNPLTDEVLDILSTVCLQSNDVRRCLNARHSSVLSLGQAAKLMKVIANNSHSTVQLIEIELSKAYLYRALRCKDSDCDSIYCLANVYLAVLYYTTGQYQKAIDHCTLVTRSQDYTQCISRVVEGELLLKIDDEVDTILGLAVFYQYLRTTALNEQQTQYVGVFTMYLFSHYLHIRSLSITIRCRQLTQTPLTTVQRYEKYFYELQGMFITDVLLFHFVKRRKYSTNCRNRHTIVSDQTMSGIPHSLDTSELVDLLQQSAVEHLTTCRRLEAQEFSSVMSPIVTTDFEALYYAYKCGEYQRCLRLSSDNVRTLIGNTGISGVDMYAEFIQLMDSDIVSLIGLTVIVNPSRNHNGSYCHHSVNANQLSLSLYLMTQCQMKLHHSPTSLAQTLKYIVEVARPQFRKDHTFDNLLLKLTEHKILLYIYGAS